MALNSSQPSWLSLLGLICIFLMLYSGPYLIGVTFWSCWPSAHGCRLFFCPHLSWWSSGRKEGVYSWCWRLSLHPLSSEPLWPFHSDLLCHLTQCPPVFMKHPPQLTPLLQNLHVFIVFKEPKFTDSIQGGRRAWHWTRESFLLRNPEVFLAILDIWIHHNWHLTMVPRALETWTWDRASSITLLRYAKGHGIPSKRSDVEFSAEDGWS